MNGDGFDDVRVHFEFVTALTAYEHRHIVVGDLDKKARRFNEIHIKEYRENEELCEISKIKSPSVLLLISISSTFWHL